MRLNLYAIRDKLASFLYVVVSANDDVAKRDFLIQYEDSKCVKDMELYRVGTFDVDSGEVTPSVPEFICRGENVEL